MLLPSDEEQLNAFMREYQKLHPSPRGLIKRLFKILAFFSGFAFISLAVILTIFLRSYYDQDDGKILASLVEWHPEDNSLVFDTDGNIVGEFYSEDHIFIPLEKIPNDLINAVISIEDRKFWHHHGIDYHAMLRALWINSVEKKSFAQGGSTITQQLVRYSLLGREKTLDRKLREIALAQRLEKMLTKERILEIYLNSLFLGNGSYGVASAARRYFNRPLTELKTHEFALLAGLFQSPSRFNPLEHPDLALARQQQVLRAMRDTGAISPSDYDDLIERDLRYEKHEGIHAQYAPYFVDYVQESARQILGLSTIKNAGLRIYSTLNMQLQTLAEKSVSTTFLKDRHLKAINRNQLEAALLSVLPQTGEIVAMVGGRDYRKSQFNRCTQAKRQPGSLFKPIVYTYALMQGYRWSDVLFVSPITLEGGYRPRSLPQEYMKETTLLRAFFRSMNSPTLELGQKLGMSSISQFAGRLGIHSPIRNEFGSLLGASETTMLELATVYATFANFGIQHELSAIRKIEDGQGRVLYERARPSGKQVIPKRVSYLALEGMRQVLERGTAASFAQFASWTVGKTGTTNDANDNWFVGFSPNLLSIVWVGPDHKQASAPDWLQGATAALPIWARFMEGSQKIIPSSQFEAPEDVVSMRIDPVYGQISEIDGIPMWFLKENLPKKDSGLSKIRPDANYRNPL